MRASKKAVEDEKRTKPGLKLLENQLKDAERKKIKKERIANELVLELIWQYLAVLKVENAEALYKKYKTYFNLKHNEKSLTIIGELYRKTSRFEEALDRFFKVQEMQEKTGNKASLRDTFYYIGTTYYDKGEPDKSLEYLLKSKELYEQGVETERLGLLLMEIGMVYLIKGFLDRYIEYLMKARVVFEKIGKQPAVDIINLSIKDAKLIKSPSRR